MLNWFTRRREKRKQDTARRVSDTISSAVQDTTDNLIELATSNSRAVGGILGIGAAASQSNNDSCSSSNSSSSDSYGGWDSGSSGGGSDGGGCCGGGCD